MKAVALSVRYRSLQPPSILGSGQQACWPRAVEKLNSPLFTGMFCLIIMPPVAVVSHLAALESVHLLIAIDSLTHIEKF